MLEDQQGRGSVPGTGTLERNADCGMSNIDTATLSNGTSNTQAWMERFSRNYKLNDHRQPCTWRKAPCKKPPPLLESVPSQSKFGDEVVSKVLLLTRWRTRARQQADSKSYSMACRRPLLAHFREVTERSGCVLGAAMEHDGIESHVRMKLQLSHAEEDERIAHAAEEHLKDFTPMEVIRERVKRAMSGVQLWTAGSSRVIDPDVLPSVDTDGGETPLGLPQFATLSNDGSGQQTGATSLTRRSPLTRSRKLAPGGRSSGAVTINGQLQPQTPDPWRVDEDELSMASGSLMLRAASDPGEASVRESYAGSVLAGATSDDEVVRGTNDGVAWPDEDDGIDVAPSQAGGGGSAVAAGVPSPPLSLRTAVATGRHSTGAVASVDRVTRGGPGAGGAVGVYGAGELESRVAAAGSQTVTAAALTSSAALNAGATPAAVVNASAAGPRYGTVNAGAAAAEARAAEATVAAAPAAAPTLSRAGSVARLASPTAGLEAPGADEAAVTDPRVGSGPQGNHPGVKHPLGGTMQLIVSCQQEFRVLDPVPAEPAPTFPVQLHGNGGTVDPARPRQDAFAASEQPEGEPLPSGSTALVPEPGPSWNQTEPTCPSLVLPILHDVSPGLGTVDACTVAATLPQPPVTIGGRTTRPAPAPSSIILTKQARGKRRAAAAATAGRGAAKPLAPPSAAMQGQGQGQGRGSRLATGRQLAPEQQSLNSRALVLGGGLVSGRPVELAGEGLDSGEPGATARAAPAAVAQPPQPSASLAMVNLAAFFDRPKGQAPVRQKSGLAGGTHPPKRVLAHVVSEHARAAGGGTSLGLGAAAAAHPSPSPPQQLSPPPASPPGVVPDKPARSPRVAATDAAQPHIAAKEGDTGDASSGGDVQGDGGPCRTAADGRFESVMPYQPGPQPEQPSWSPGGSGPHGLDGLKGCDTISPLLPSYSPADGLPRLQVPAGGDAQSGELAPRVSSGAIEVLGRTSPRSSQPGFLPYFDTSPSGASASMSGEAGTQRIMTFVQQQQQPLPAVGHSPCLQQVYGKPVGVNAVPGPVCQSPSGPAAAAFGRLTGLTSPMRLPRAAPDSPSLLHKDIPLLQVQQQPQSLQQQTGSPACQEQGQGEQLSPSGVWAIGRVMPAVVSPPSLSRLARAVQDDFSVSARQQPVLSPNRHGPQRSAVSLTAVPYGSHPHPLSQPQPQLPRQHLAPLRPNGTTHPASFVAAATVADELGYGGGGGVSAGGAAPTPTPMPTPMPSLNSPGPGQRNLSRLASESLNVLLDVGSPSTNRLAPVVPSQRAGGTLASSKAFLPELRPSVVGRDSQAAATRGSAVGAGGRSPMLDGLSAADARTALAPVMASQSLPGEDFSTVTAMTRLPDLISPAFLSSGGAVPPPPSGLVRGLIVPPAQQASSHRSRLAAMP